MFSHTKSDDFCGSKTTRWLDKHRLNLWTLDFGFTASAEGIKFVFVMTNPLSKIRGSLKDIKADYAPIRIPFFVFSSSSARVSERSWWWTKC